MQDQTTAPTMDRTLEEAERRFRVTVDSLLEGVAVLDSRGVIEFVNPSAARLLGVEPADVLGVPLLGLPWEMYAVDGTPRPRESHPAFVALTTRRPVQNDRMQVVVGDAPTRLWLEVSAVPLTPDAPDSAVVCSFRDVSTDARVRRLQRELIGVVAHELRSPLASLLGALRMLADGDGTGHELLPMALRNAERLERLVTDLLDLERIEGGQLALQYGTVDCRALFDDALDVLAPAIADRQLRVVRCDATVRLPGDPERLAQVIRNLLSNAVKFSPVGGRLVLEATREGGDVRLSVTDEGRGIPPHLRTQVFERFRQVSPEDGTRLGGAGLGLSIAQSIVEAHGGRIRAEAGPDDRGSRFVVTLPASPAARPADEPR